METGDIMLELLKFFDTSGYPARWFCGKGWEQHPGLGWLHIISDIAIFAAYFTIPCILIYFLRKRRDLPFRMIFLLFGAFILSCGTTHLIDAIIFWWPIYPMAGLMKAATAIVSWATVMALVRVVPTVLNMRSPQELEREVSARVKAEASLILANQQLEERIRERTSELSRANELLHQEREWLKATLLSIGDGVIATDINGRITMLNPVAQNLTGWSLLEAVDQPIESVFKVINENTRQPVENPAIGALQRGCAVTLANHTLLIRKDNIEHPISDSGAPIRDSSGKLSGAVLVFRDETDRRERERSLLLSRQRLDLVVNSSEIGLWYCDLPFANLDWNAKCKEHFWLQPDQQITIDIFYARLHPEDRERTRICIEHALQSNSNYDIEYRTVSPNGDIRWIRAIGRGFQNTDGVPIRFDGITVDVTERKKNEEALRDAHLSKDRFLATLAHELRNPLAPLRTGLRILRLSKEKNSTTIRTEEMMDRQLTAMVRLVDDLLDISRISSGKLLLRKEFVEIKSVINQAIEASRPLIDASNHTLTVELPDYPMSLCIDAVRIAQVLQNLLNNAAKFTEQNGYIHVKLTYETNIVKICIRDTGIGIASENLEKVFDMFTQFSGKTDHAYDGLGIGLSLSKSLIEMHEGTIAVSSEGGGKGTEFVITLPKNLEVTDESKLEKSDSFSNNEMRILIVDDNQDAAESLAVFLSLAGHTCKVVYDAKSALAEAPRFSPNIILSDIGLPDMDGYALARQIRKEEWGKTLALVAVSGWGQSQDIARSKEAGFNLHLTKPVDPDQLLKELQKFASIIL